MDQKETDLQRFAQRMRVKRIAQLVSLLLGLALIAVFVVTIVLLIQRTTEPRSVQAVNQGMDKAMLLVQSAGCHIDNIFFEGQRFLVRLKGEHEACHALLLFDAKDGLLVKVIHF